MAPEYQGKGDEQEKLIERYKGTITARGPAEAGKQGEIYLNALHLAIDILQTAVEVIKTSTPGGELYQRLRTYFGVGNEADALGHSFDVFTAQRLLGCYTKLLDFMSALAGERQNQVVFTGSYEHTTSAAVNPKDPHHRIIICASFFMPEYRYSQSRTLIHEVSHIELDTQDFYYHTGVKISPESSAGRARHDNVFDDFSSFIHHAITPPKELDETWLAGGREKFAEATGFQPFQLTEAVQAFRINSKTRIELMLKNADSIADLAVLIAVPYIRKRESQHHQSRK